MATGAGQAGQQPVMYYYMAVPSNQYVQGGEVGMNSQAGFDQQAMAGFVPSQSGYGYSDQGDSSSMGGMGMQMAHNMQPGMMQAGQQGQMVGQQHQMMMMAMVPQQQQQAAQPIEPAPDPGQQASWGQMAAGPPQAAREKQATPASSPSNAARTPGSKALKIINPKTMESIQAGSDGNAPARSATGRSGHDMGSGAVPPVAQQQAQQPQQPQQQMQALPPQQPHQQQLQQHMWTQQQQPQQFAHMSNMPMQGMQMQASQLHQKQQPGPPPAQQSHQQQPPQQQLPPQQPQQAQLQAGAAPAAAPAPAAAAPTLKKNRIKNVTIKKSVADAPSATPADSEDASAAAVAQSSELKQESAKASAPAPTPAAPAAPPALAPESEAAQAEAGRKPAEGAAAPAAQSQSQAAPAGGGGEGLAPLAKLPPFSGPATMFASSIKALNLEPMRPRPNTTRLQSQTSVPAAPPSAQPQRPPQAPEQEVQAAGQPAPPPKPAVPEAQLAPQVPRPVVQPVVQPVQMQQVALQQMPQQPLVQLQMPAPVVPQAALPVAAADGARKKGIKLKNAAMARPGGAPRTDDAKDGDGPGGGDKLSSSRAIAALDFNPPDKVFEKVLMLRIRRALRDDPPMLTSLKVSSRPEEKTPTAGDARNKHGRPEREADRRPLVGQDFKSYSKKKTDQGGSGGGAGGMSVKSITTGKGYKITEPVKREEDIERRVRALLNKICPDNLKIIVDQLAGVDLHKAEELEHVIRIIFSKALAEPHYCETYADMVFSLRSRYPEFPPEHEGEKAHSFTRILLNTVQNEFENLPTTFEPTEEDKQSYSADDLRLEIGKKKAKVLANMKFIGNLFLRQLLAVKVIGQVVHDLIGIKETPIEEHMIECVCELLKAIGYSLDNTPHGKMLVTQFSHRLMDLKKEMDPTTGRSLFSKRIQFQIQDLIDLRGRNWQQKLFKEQAKTKDEVRKDAAKEAYKTAKSGPEAMFATQVAGMRPSYIEELKSDRSQPGRRQVHEHQRGQFDQVHVRRCFQYYAEERKPKDLQDEWMKPQPTKEQAKQGMEWLCEIGFNDAEKEDIVAETVVQLVAQLKIVHWEILKEALAPMLDTLEDVAIDVPTAPKFVHSLYARFIHTCGRDFNTTLLKILPLKDKDGSVMVWDLLVGILKRLKQIGGPQGTTLVRKALDMKEFQDAACGAKKCEPSQVNQLFRSAGVQA